MKNKKINNIKVIENLKKRITDVDIQLLNLKRRIEKSNHGVHIFNEQLKWKINERKDLEQWLINIE